MIFKQNRKPLGLGGYTIIEAMIFLTVSVGLFAGVVATYSAQNRRTQFTQSVNTFAQEMQDMLNDVETGFFPSSDNISCVVHGGAAGTLGISEGTVEQGTNQDCVFAGKAVQFSVGSSDYDIYTLAGKRGAENVDGASIKAVNFLKDSGYLTAGVEVTKVFPVSSPGIGLSGVATLSSFGAEITATSTGSGLGNRTILGSIDSAGVQPTGEVALGNSSVVQARQGIVICVQDGEGGRKATVEVGVNSQQSVSVNVDSDDSRCNFS